MTDNLPEYPYEDKDLIETWKERLINVDQDKIIKWLDEHKKEIGLVLLTALVTSKFNSRRNNGTNAILQTQDGSVWVLPTKNS